MDMRTACSKAACVAVLAVITACTSSPLDPQAAKPVPGDRVESAAVVDRGGPLPAGQARMRFVRDFAFEVSACPYDIYVDDQQLFTLGDSETLTLQVPAGLRRVRLELGHGLCRQFQTGVQIDVPTGQTALVRAWLNGGRPALKAELQR